MAERTPTARPKPCPPGVVPDFGGLEGTGGGSPSRDLRELEFFRLPEGGHEIVPRHVSRDGCECLLESSLETPRGGALETVDDMANPKDAARKARWRASLETTGVRQLNVLAPESIHPALREIAERTRAGESLHAVMLSMVPLGVAPGGTVENVAGAGDADAPLPSLPEAAPAVAVSAPDPAKAAAAERKKARDRLNATALRRGFSLTMRKGADHVSLIPAGEAVAAFTGTAGDAASFLAALPVLKGK